MQKLSKKEYSFSLDDTRCTCSSINGLFQMTYDKICNLSQTNWQDYMYVHRFYV